MSAFGQQVLVAVNRFESDPQDELSFLEQWCKDHDVAFALNDGYAKGGDGAKEMASKIVELTLDKTASPVNHVYDLQDGIKEKIEKVVRRVYGGDGVVLSKKAIKNLKRIDALGLNQLPVCIAKTQYSFTDKPEAVSVYSGFTITVDDLVINNGAGFIVAVCGEMVRMPSFA